MTPATDEAALWRAIEADPRDDAPWLVYADWLDDHGRDHEAAFVRRSLPDVQGALLAGYDPAAVRELLARQDPTYTAWMPPKTNTLPAAPTLAPAERAGPPRPGLSAGSWLLLLAVPAVVGLSKAVLAPGLREREQLPPDLIHLAPQWSADTVAGHNLRLDSETEVLVLHLKHGGAAEIARGTKGQQLDRIDGRWSIKPYGPLVVTTPMGTPVCRLDLVRVHGVRFEVNRDGRPAVFYRERPGLKFEP